MEDTAEQVSTVDTFTQSRGLKLCLEKCALLSSGHTPTNITAAGTLLTVESSVKCLGVWWDSSLSSKTSRINKARSAFFSHGELGAFHGLLNPLSSRSLIECCIVPVLMYGSESWVLNSTLLSKLESFQAELGKRILKLPKHTSNTIPLLVLNWPSMCTRILCSKLAFLQSVIMDETTDSLRSRVFSSIAASDVWSMSIVKQCKFLEEKLISNHSFTENVLSQTPSSIRDLKKQILDQEHSYSLKATRLFNIPSGY